MPRDEATKRWMKKHGLTAVAIAKTLGVHRVTVERWLTDITKPTGRSKRDIVLNWGSRAPILGKKP